MGNYITFIIHKIRYLLKYHFLLLSIIDIWLFLLKFLPICGPQSSQWLAADVLLSIPVRDKVGKVHFRKSNKEGTMYKSEWVRQKQSLDILKGPDLDQEIIIPGDIESSW